MDRKLGRLTGVIGFRFAIAACLAAACVDATAQQKEQADEFWVTLSSSLYPCELNVSLIQQQVRNYGVSSAATNSDQSKCLHDAGQSMRIAFDKYRNSSPPAAELDAAKNLYAATLAWSSAIAGARSSQQLASSIEKAELRKAEALFKIEAGL